MPNIANITISHGSILRPDKERKENVSMTLAKMGLIDPYNLFKDLGLKDADKRYESLVKFKMAPDQLVSDVKSEVQDRDAYIDFAVIMNGQEATPRQDIQPAHILAHREQLMTDRFLYAKPELQQAFIRHIETEVMMLSQRAKLEEADKAGLLIDPATPVTPQPPQLPPPMPPMGGMPGGMPPMPGAPGMPPQGAPQPQPAPMPGGGGGMPVMDAGGGQGGVLSSLLPGM